MRQKRSPFKPKAKGSYRIEAKSDEATVYIYDEISWWGVDAQQFVKDLEAVTANTIHLRINSPGGAVFDGTAIYNTLKQHEATVITHIDGLAASISSIIALAGDEVRMGENAFFMIHEPWSIVIGMADDLRKEADLLDKVGGALSNIYQTKTGKSEQEILDYMAAETWFTAQEALEAGFIDVIENDKGEEKAQASLFDLSVFANVPESLINKKEEPTAREVERILKDIGCSETRRKAMIAEGFKCGPRDVDDIENPAMNDRPRDVDSHEAVIKDRIADLLIRAEIAAPSL
jgi:ATP-dependent Clp protease, protease subunit